MYIFFQCLYEFVILLSNNYERTILHQRKIRIFAKSVTFVIDGVCVMLQNFDSLRERNRL